MVMPDIFDTLPVKGDVFDSLPVKGDEPGIISKAWNYLNTPLLKSDPTMDKARSEFARIHPIIGGVGNFATDVLKSTTSPLSLGLAATTGGASLAGEGTLGTALELPGKIAAGGMVGHGLYRVGTEPTTAGKVGGGLEVALGGLGLRVKSPDFLDSVPIKEDVPKPVEVAAESSVPEIRAAAQDVQKKGIIQRIKDKIPSFPASLEAQLQQQGPAGQLISDKIARASLKERMYKSQWLAQSPTANDLSPQDFENAVDVIEKGTQPNNDEVAKAAKEMSSVLNDAGQKLTSSGISTQTQAGQIAPFQMRDSYFPHYYPEGFWERPDVLDNLVKSGISRDQALDMLLNRKKYGELLSPFQHQRIPTDLPGYAKTSDAYEQYLNSASRRLAMAQELGPEDITGKPLNSLIEQTADPTRTTQILRRIIPGRDQELSPTEQAIQPLNNLTSKLMAYTHLSRYAISRIAPSTEMILQGGARNYLSEMIKVLTDAGYGNDIKTGTGVTENIGNAMLDAVNKYPKNWMMSKSVDDFMRTVSGGMGRGLAEDLFQKLKTNPNDLSSIKRLQNLLLENPQEVLKQPTLTKDQINMAGARFSEITQGLPENRKVPMAMSEPLLQIPLIMKKYAFQHGAMLKNAIMQNPTKGIPLALGLTQLFGEGIGDTKAILKGVGSAMVDGEGPADKIANRGRFESMLMKRAGLPDAISDNPALGRLSDNFANAWVPFEIELLQTISDKAGLAKVLGGPAIGDVSELSGGGITGAAKYVGGNFPVIGSR
jgi:hypothetical protein